MTLIIPQGNKKFRKTSKRKLGVVRPEIATDDLLEYLDELRESGVTNMFGAGSYLERDFGLDRKEAREVLVYWMESFGEIHPKE